MKDYLKECRICPRGCGVDRTKGELGFCKAGARAEVYAAHLHYGEEPPISGTRGSGTIFFSHCNLRCAYCQNFRFSQWNSRDKPGARVEWPGGGREYDDDGLAGLMLWLAGENAHNINLVTPTHYIPQIYSALKIARKKGLKIPVVYNTSGYEKAAILRELEGMIDIYLPDMRYGDNGPAERFSAAPDYVEVNRAAVREMHRQAGALQTDASGAAVRGLIIRHLILPAGLSGTESVLRFIAEEVSKETYISFMSQYYPAYRAFEYPELKRRLTLREYKEALAILHKYGLDNGWIQGYMGDAVDPEFAGTDIEPM